MLGQFGVASGIALGTLCMQWRSSVCFVRLDETLSLANPAVQDTLDRLTRHLAVTHDLASAPQMAMAQLGNLVAQEATLMAALDYFHVLFVFAAVGLALVLLQRMVRSLLQTRPA